MKKNASILLICALMLSMCVSLSSCGEEKMTLMVYMVGSDLESRTMAASNDMVEMLSSKLDTDRVNLVIFTGGSEMWYNNVSHDSNSTFLLTGKKEQKSFKLLKKSKKNSSMGKSETLEGFVNYSCEKFPADRYALICWDHGNGPLIGFGRDKLFDNDSMELSELKTALSKTPFSKEKKLDFIGFDACLMSSFEVCGALSPFAKYLIASQETEPGDGWNYSFLKKLNSTFDTKEIAGEILNSYYDHYEKEKSSTFNPDLTLACLDLTKTEQTAQSMDRLFAAMEKTLSDGAYQSRAVERSSMKSFGNSSSSSRGRSLDLVDLRDMASVCKKTFPDESSDLMSALGEMVVLNKTNLKNACGLSVYYPYDGAYVYAENGADKYKTLGVSKNQLSYMSAFINTWSKDWLKADNSVDEQYDSVPDNDVIDEDKIVSKLTDEQKKNFDKAFVHIYRRDDLNPGENYLTPVLYGRQIKPDSDGNLSISRDEKIPTVNGKSNIILVENSRDSESRGYRSVYSGISCIHTDSKEVVINCRQKNGENDLLITSIEYDDGDGFEGKNTINAKRWEKLKFLIPRGKPKRSDNGALLPYDKWDNYVSLWTEESINSDFILKMTPLSEVKGDKPDDFCYQFEIRDTRGRSSFSEIKSFEDTNTTTRKNLKTPKGNLAFDIYKNRAVLVSYEGKDKNVTIPAEIDKIPVASISGSAFDSVRDNPLDCLTIEGADTEIGRGLSGVNARKIVLPEGLRVIPSGAFEDNSNVEEITIPSTVERIGERAFMMDYEYSLKRLVIPKGVSYIGHGAFAGINDSSVVSLENGCDGYVIEKNMLFSKDKKLLLACFTDKNTEITIPDGVEEISPYSHIGKKDQRLSRINLPKSLKIIGYDAFEHDAPERLEIPDGVKEIGHFAFCCGVDDDVPVVKSVSLGKGLMWLGQTIIGSAKCEKLSVSLKNPFFSEKDNRLYNKAKDSDLSEAALSSWDNLERNRVEYEKYSLVKKEVDLSHYNNSDSKNNIKEYKGDSYSLSLRLKKKYNRFAPDTRFTLQNRGYSFYDKVSKLLKGGLTITNDDVPETFWYRSFYIARLESKNGAKLSLSAKNFSRKPCKINDCGFTELSIESENRYSMTEEKRDLVPFSYMGFTEKSDIHDAVKAFGEPTSVEISQFGTITLSYSIPDAEYSYEKALELEFTVVNNKPLLCGFKLNTE